MQNYFHLKNNTFEHEPMNVCDQTMASCMGPNGFSHLTHLLEHNCALINHLPQIINNMIYKHDFLFHASES